MAGKFTPELRGAILDHVGQGVSLPDTARSLDLRLPTLKGWLTRGRREKTGDYADFARDVDRVRQEAEARPEPMDQDELLHVVSKAARKGSVQAMKLRWEMILASRNEEEEPEGEDAGPLAEVHELARLRSA